MYASTYQAALAWAARGFKVFPLAQGTKDKPLVPFTQEATSDPATISAWWHDPLTGAEHGHNVGVLTTNMVVVDIDVANGKPGLASFQALGGQFNTLTVRTPTGGYHCYFNGPDSAGLVGTVGAGVDIRSHGNYVLAPGSWRAEGGYDLVLDAPVADVPDGIAAKLRPAGAVADAIDTASVDHPSSIATATHYLTTAAPPAIEGMGGDNTTYQVACRLRDFGLSETTAANLMAALWNGRCSPPWTLDEIIAKVGNAYAYATGPAGVQSVGAAFSDVAIAPPDLTAAAAAAATGLVTFGNAIDPDEIEPRRWIMKGLLLKRAVASIVATGGAGKSMQLLAIAAHLALGLDYMGFVNSAGPMRSIIVNAEDDLEEQSRRLAAVCQEFGLPYLQVRSQIAFIQAFKLMNGDPPILAKDDVQQLLDAAAAPDVGLLGLDPFVEIHDLPEDDNTKMKSVMAVLREFARKSDTAVVILHHTSKAGAASGVAGSSRGASSISAATRLSFAITAADKIDAQNYGIPPDKLASYAKWENAKANVTAHGGAPKWLVVREIKLPNGDGVGVWRPIELRLDAGAVGRDMARTIIHEMTAQGVASATLAEAAALLGSADPIYGAMTARAVAGRIRAHIGARVETEIGNLRIVHEVGRAAVVVID